MEANTGRQTRLEEMTFRVQRSSTLLHERDEPGIDINGQPDVAWRDQADHEKTEVLVGSIM